MTRFLFSGNAVITCVINLQPLVLQYRANINVHAGCCIGSLSDLWCKPLLSSLKTVHSRREGPQRKSKAFSNGFSCNKKKRLPGQSACKCVSSELLMKGDDEVVLLKGFPANP